MTAPETQAALREAVSHALATGTRWLRFPAALERQYEAETARRRARTLRIACLIALVLFDIFIVADLTMLPDVAWLALIVRFGIVTPLVLLVLLLLTVTALPRLLRESAMIVVTLAAVLGVLALFLASRSPLAAHYQYGVWLALLFANIMLPLPFWYACVTSALVVACHAAALWAHPLLDFGARLSFSLEMLTATLVTLGANYRMDMTQRLAYLHRVRERLHRLELSESNRRLTRLSRRDALTGLANRRSLESYLTGIWRTAEVESRPVGLLMIDIDRFKAYNDSYGHPAGDECLCRVAQAIEQQMRGGLDLLARYGGEEFIVVLPGLTLAQASRVGERVRHAVEQAAIPHGGAGDGGAGEAAVVTVSVGAGSARPDSALSPHELLATADAALYQAKQRGRNRVWPTPDAPPLHDAADDTDTADDAPDAGLDDARA